MVNFSVCRMWKSGHFKFAKSKKSRSQLFPEQLSVGQKLGEGEGGEEAVVVGRQAGERGGADRPHREGEALAVHHGIAPSSGIHSLLWVRLSNL